MKELVKMVVMFVVLGAVIWVGKNYYDNQINSPVVVNTDEAIIGSLKIETISSVEGYELKIRNEDALAILLPEIDDSFQKSIQIELVSDPQEWYRVAYEDSEDFISSVGIDEDSSKVTLKIHLSEEEILKLPNEDRDWILNNVTLTALYALVNEWETEDLVEQDIIVERLDENASVELPFEIL